MWLLVALCLVADNYIRRRVSLLQVMHLCFLPWMILFFLGRLSGLSCTFTLGSSHQGGENRTALLHPSLSCSLLTGTCCSLSSVRVLQVSLVISIPWLVSTISYKFLEGVVHILWLCIMIYGEGESLGLFAGIGGRYLERKPVNLWTLAQFFLVGESLKGFKTNIYTIVYATLILGDEKL